MKRYYSYPRHDTDPRYRLNDINCAYRCATGDPITLNGGLDLTRDNAGNPLTREITLGAIPVDTHMISIAGWERRATRDRARSPIHMTGLVTKRVYPAVCIMRQTNSRREPDIHTSMMAPET